MDRDELFALLDIETGEEDVYKRQTTICAISWINRLLNKDIKVESDAKKGCENQPSLQYLKQDQKL